MPAASIVFNQALLCASTGNAVTFVFQMLSAGKTGHFVPGSVVPVLAVLAAALVVAPAGGLDDALATVEL